MADIRPFRGLRFSSCHLADLSASIAPPYDIITPEQQHYYHQEYPRNIIRLEYGEDLPEDTQSNNKYTRAAHTLDQWINQGILARDERPALYLVEHCFQHNHQPKNFWGLIAAVRLEEFSTRKIRPTEVTMDTPAADRLNLLRACRTNISPTMGIFDCVIGKPPTPFSELALGDPTESATDIYGSTFNLWVITQENLIADITANISNSVIYIADGHHRYRTAMVYRNEQISAGSGNDVDTVNNWVMMTLIESHDPGLTILPVHRLVRDVEMATLTKLKEYLHSQFTVNDLTGNSLVSKSKMKSWLKTVEKAGENGVAFGIYGLEPGRFSLISHPDRQFLANQLSAEMPQSWRKMDMSILQGLILQSQLNIDTKEKETSHLDYTHDADAAQQKMDDGEVKLAFFLNAIPVSSVMAIADDGATMPPKSTYFHPKTPAGLVLNPLWD